MSPDVARMLSQEKGRAQNICPPWSGRVKEKAQMMSDESARGISIETAVLSTLRGRSDPMSPRDMADSIGREIRDVRRVMERMYWSSKLEKRNPMNPVYRIPGKNDGKLSLPN